MITAAANVFVSYSHADVTLVAPIVSLLRATNASVFRDSDSIKPGKKWREEIEAAIGKANLVIVFWCHHSTESNEVAKEYLHAIRLEKDVLPIRLDGTQLPTNLSQYQALDFSSMAGQYHLEPPQTSQAPRIGVIARIRGWWTRRSKADYEDSQTQPARQYQHTGAQVPRWQELDAIQQSMAEMIQKQMTKRLIHNGRGGA